MGPNNHILTQNLYYNHYYPNPKYKIIGYMNPPSKSTLEEFFSILDRPEALTALSQLGVDHFAAKETWSSSGE